MNLTAPKHIAVLIAAVILVVVLVFTRSTDAPSEQGIHTGDTATTTISDTGAAMTIPVMPAPLAENKGSARIEAVAAGKPIAWNYQGTITDTSGKEDVFAAINQLNAQMGEHGADVYDLDLSIAQKYALIGDGERAYRYLTYATVVAPEKALAFLNIGNLFVQLKSYDTAETAFLIAVEKEPQFPYTHLGLISFYTLYQPTETAKIEKAFAFALEHTSRNETVLKEYAAWLEGQGRVREAIVVWKEVLARAPANATAVSTKIVKLELKLNETGN